MAPMLFAGIAVAEFATALSWYESLLGGPPAFLPHPTEAVWEVAEGRFIYIFERRVRAGHSVVTMLVDDLDARVAGIAGRGLDPVESETYPNGARKITYADRDGNEVGFGQAPS